jgi:cation diffusion facilitator family transporter
MEVMAMHTHSLEPWTHSHRFLGVGHRRNERRTQAVVALTVVMMIGEIVGGQVFGSLALVADGWHMATHAAAIGISALAYTWARRHSDNPRFTFGTGKVGDLAAFASAIVLGIVSLGIAYECFVRLSTPTTIYYREAMAIAVLGLVVNLASAWLLRGDDHGHHHAGGHAGHHHHDHNLRSAYLHVLADAATSVAAIAGLGAALLFGWTWMDPVVGLVGAVVIASWAITLLRDSGAVLLDMSPQGDLEKAVRLRLEQGDDRVTDLHVWQVGPGHRAAVIALVSDHPKLPSVYKRRLAGIPGLSHVTIEVERCSDHGAPVRPAA